MKKSLILIPLCLLLIVGCSSPKTQQPSNEKKTSYRSLQSNDLFAELQNDTWLTMQLTGPFLHIKQQSSFNDVSSDCRILLENIQETKSPETSTYIDEFSTRIDALAALETPPDQTEQKNGAMRFLKDRQRIIQFMQTQTATNCKKIFRDYQANVIPQLSATSDNNFEKAKQLGIISEDYMGYNR